MTLSRRALSAIVLVAGVTPAPAALAWDIPPKVILMGGKDPAHERIQASVGAASGVGSLTATISSDVGEEEVELEPVDTWLHGAGAFKALPAADAELTFTLYDSGSAALATYDGTLGADGWIRLAGTAGKDAPDIELRAAEVRPLAGLRDGYPDASDGYDLAVSLGGADTYDVAYATLTITEPATKICVASDEKGNCLKWEESKAVNTRAEVYWDDLETVWEAETSYLHEGEIGIKVKAQSPAGEALDPIKVQLAAPWEDDGAGVGTLAIDEDPLTTLALTPPRHLGANQRWHAMALVSEGWSATGTLPTEAQLALTDGETLEIPVNNYQRRITGGSVTFGASTLGLFDTGATVTVTSGSLSFRPLSVDDLGVPVCTEGLCLTLVAADDGDYGLAVTAYALKAAALPEKLEFKTIVDDLDDEIVAEEFAVTFDDEITAVFAHEISFYGDPIGLGLSGKVKLLGEADRKGKQETLAKGKFYGAFSRDPDGDLSLAGADEDDVTSSSGVIQPGDAVALTPREGVAAPPPAIQYGNGSGTKNASSSTSTRPQLL